MFEKLDPILLSLFNVKYIYGDMDYYKMIDTNLYENPHPLAIGFAVNDEIKDLELNQDFPEYNLSKIINTLTGETINMYDYINYDKFELYNLTYTMESSTLSLIDKTKDGFAKTIFTSEKDYLLEPNEFTTNIKRNGININEPEYFVKINKGDKIEITYKVEENKYYTALEAKLLNINVYESVMKNLETDLLKAKTHINGHILEGEIDITTENDYLFTSIEYEEGMKIYVDGKRIEPDIVLDTLIGIKLSKGHHTIIIDYIPKGFTLGTIITVVSILSAFVYLQKKKKSL